RSADDKPRAAPAKGKTVLLGTWGWNADTDQQKDPKGPDVWWQRSGGQGYLVPRGKAGLAVVADKAFDKLTREDLAALKYTPDKIAGKTLTPGTVLALQTNQGNFAKLKVVGYRDSDDFSFPEAKFLSEDRRERLKKNPTKDYHLEVEWVLYKN